VAERSVGAKGEATRGRIVDAALALFTERGYDATTMRAIAAEAGVSLGSAYQYFAGKDHLVQAFYVRSQQEHRQAAAPALASSRALSVRLHAALTARIDTMQPYRAFAAAFFRTASDPDSPLSPFSPQSAAARELATAIYADVVTGSDATVPPELGRRLPELLWLVQMGVVLFWVHDRSADARRTYLLIDRAVRLIDRLVGLSRYRLLRPLLTDALDLVDEISGSPA
jgi:AcrR family transcriptional regulator